MMPLSSFGLARVCASSHVHASTSTRNYLGRRGALSLFVPILARDPHAPFPLAMCSCALGLSGVGARAALLVDERLISDHLRRERDDLHNRLSRSSRPRPEDAGRAGSPWSVMSTAAFSSNRMWSILRLVSLAAPRSPPSPLRLFTWPWGWILIVTTTMSPSRVAALGPAQYADHERASRARVVAL